MRPKLIFEDELKEYIELNKIRIREDNLKIEVLRYLEKGEWKRIDRVVRRFGYRYVYGCRGWIYEGWLPPVIVPEHWELRERDAIIVRPAVQYTVNERFYLVKDKINKEVTWIVPHSGNPNAIFVHDPQNEDGFGGALVTFTLVDGREVRFRGPWHSNPDSLYERTGIDLRVERRCPYSYTNPKEECPYYESGAGRWSCKKKLTEWDDPCGERCVKE